MRTGALAAAALAALPGAALAQAVLPAPLAASPVLPLTGTDPRIGDLSAQIDAATGLAPVQDQRAPRWQFSPSIEVDEGFTDHVLAFHRTGADVFTRIAPNLLLSADSPRVQGSLAYTPRLDLYARDGSLDGLWQNFTGTAQVTLIPDLLYLDLRGLASDQSLFGATPSNALAAVGPGQEALTTSFLAAPWLVHRFGGFGTGQLGTSIARTDTGTPAGNFTTEQAYAAFTSGEMFGRMQHVVQLRLSQSQGTGVLRGAQRNTASYNLGYALTRGVTLLAGIGYEDIRYGGLPPLRIDDMTWNAGVRLTPNPDSRITVTYGRQDGLESLFLDASYAPDARSLVTVRYSEGLTTQGQETENALAQASVGPAGNAVDPTTRAPLILAGNAFGEQDGLYRLRRLSATGLLRFDRDSFAATVAREARHGIAAGTPGTAIVSTASIYGNLSWTHALTPALSGTLLGQYGTTDTPRPQQTGGGTTQYVLVNASLSYAISETLTGSLQYSFTDRSGTLAGTNPTQNLVFLGVRKSF